MDQANKDAQPYSCSHSTAAHEATPPTPPAHEAVPHPPPAKEAAPPPPPAKEAAPPPTHPPPAKDAAPPSKEGAHPAKEAPPPAAPATPSKDGGADAKGSSCPIATGKEIRCYETEQGVRCYLVQCETATDRQKNLGGKVECPEGYQLKKGLEKVGFSLSSFTRSLAGREQVQEMLKKPQPILAAASKGTGSTGPRPATQETVDESKKKEENDKDTPFTPHEGAKALDELKGHDTINHSMRSTSQTSGRFLF